jgi:hypothetical protein
LVSDVPKPTRTLKSVTAAREKPSPAPPTWKNLVTNQVADKALNAASVAREGWRGFRSTDRWFKFKTLIVASWLLLTITSLVVACPVSLRKRNSLGAQLVIGKVADHPVYMVKNDGKRVWREVVVVVNGRFRAAAGMIQPGSNLTFGSKQLLGENGQAAPDDLPLLSLELRTTEGSEILVEGGRAP